MSNSYFDSSFFKSVGKVFNWLDKTNRKYDLSNLLPEDVQQTYQQLPQDPSSPGRAIPAGIGATGKAALRAPILGPVLTGIGSTGKTVLDALYFTWQNAVERPFSTQLTAYGMARDEGSALAQAAAATPFPLNVPLATATQVGKLPEIWRQTEGAGPATITPGRAIGYAITRDAAGLVQAAEVGGVSPSIINPITEAAPVLNPNFMPLDPKWQREAFTDSWLGSLTTGLTDAVFEVMVGGKGGNWLGRKFWNITGRTR